MADFLGGSAGCDVCGHGPLPAACCFRDHLRRRDAAAAPPGWSFLCGWQHQRPACAVYGGHWGYVDVTDALAQRAGLEGGELVQFRTANGVRMGRLVRAQSVTVGPLQARNLTVGTGYTGSSEQDALLGQNFLRQFDVLMRGDVLELRPR